MVSLVSILYFWETTVAYQQGWVWQPCVRRPLHHWLTSRDQSDSHVWEGHYTSGLPAGMSLTAMCKKAITPLAYQKGPVWQPCVRKAITPLAYQQGPVWQPCMGRPLHHWLTSRYQSDSHVWEGHYTTGLQTGISMTAMHGKAITPLAYQQVSVWQPCVRRPLHHWLTNRYQYDSHAWEGHYTTGLPAGISLTAMHEKGHYTTGLPAVISVTAMCEKAITPLAYQQGWVWQPCMGRPLHHWITSRYQSNSHVWEGHYTTGLPAGISLTAMCEKAITPLAYQQGSV